MIGPRNRIFDGAFAVDWYTKGRTKRTKKASAKFFLGFESWTNVNRVSGDEGTTASITGGLAGLFYGNDQISKDWIGVLEKKEDIA